MIEDIKHHVEVLTSHGERVVGGIGHKEAANYLVKEVETIGLETYQPNEFRLPYSVDGKEFLNIGARIPGTTPTTDGAILLGAHYDTCGKQPGADDNAAAVAICLEAAKTLNRTPLRHNVEILFFDAEEPPHFHTDAMGSVYYYSHQRREEIALALIPDLIGHSVPVSDMENFLFIQGMESHPKLQTLITDCENHQDLPILSFPNDYMRNMSDHHVFVNKKPFLFFTCGFWKHYHEKTDTPEKLNYEKMATIADFFLGLIQKADECDFSSRHYQSDTVDTELYLINKNLPDKFKKYSGVESFKTRSDLDRFAVEDLLPLLLWNHKPF